MKPLLILIANKFLTALKGKDSEKSIFTLPVQILMRELSITVILLSVHYKH